MLCVCSSVMYTIMLSIYDKENLFLAIKKGILTENAYYKNVWT